jgi:sugar phosphate permease
MTQNKTSLAESSQGSSRTYIVATAFLSLFAIVGIAFYGLPFFFDFMTRDFEWSRTTVTSDNALAKLIVAPLFGFIAGWLIDRYGPRRLMLVGSLFMGVALIGLGFTGGSLVLFYMFYFFNALGYVFGGPLPCQVLISRWFEKNRGKAMGIAYLGIGVGGTFVPQLATKLESGFGWNTALACLGILVIVSSMPLVFFIKEPKKNEAEAEKKAEPASVPIKNILTNPYFYLLGLGSMCAIGVVGGVGQHLKLYLRDINFSQEQAANIMSLVLMASLIGRVLMGWLADLLSRKYVMILIYLMVASAIPLLLLPDFSGRIYIFAVVYGIGLGGDYMIIPLMAGDLFGVRALGRTMGIILVADGIAESMLPMLVGATHDATGNYILGFSILICVALTGAVIISFLPKKPAHV